MHRPLFIALSLLSSPFIYAEDSTVQVSLNEKNPLDVSGTIRFQYTHNDYLADSGNKIDFFDAVLWLNYQKENWTAHLDYRAYQAHDKIAGIHYPANAWVGYQFNPEHQVKVGLQPVPIGVDRYYSSTFNLTQLYALGLEDVANLGVTYQYTPGDYQIDVGYFVRDAGSHTGKSENSSHYSSNLTSESNFAEGTQLQEKNIFAAKVSKKLNLHPELDTTIGASYFHGDVENHRTQQTGDREVWTIFQKAQYKNVGAKVVYGGQKIDSKDNQFRDYSTFGLADGYYNVANDANFLSAELNYLVDVDLGANISKPLLYSNYSRYIKDQQDYQDSERWINGVYFTYKNDFRFYLENISSRNDTAFGAANGFAEGKNSDWNQLTYLSLGYYF